MTNPATIMTNPTTNIIRKNHCQNVKPAMIGVPLPEIIM